MKSRGREARARARANLAAKISFGRIVQQISPGEYSRTSVRACVGGISPPSVSTLRSKPFFRTAAVAAARNGIAKASFSASSDVADVVVRA
ncbi:hypothetical protein [Sporisorium scitamineum]|uniref:Uncharacterized protein n=1 Tax=Sporisorium scitamineum TaxID=49012 RepID=A0A0F7RZ02_9BASI|nr:hypothetical protein [Sporisorium scitamineum]